MQAWVDIGALLSAPPRAFYRDVRLQKYNPHSTALIRKCRIFFPPPQSLYLFLLLFSSLSSFIDYSFVSHSSAEVCSKIWAALGAGLPDPVAAPSPQRCRALLPPATGGGHQWGPVSSSRWPRHLGGCRDGWSPFGCRAGCGRFVYGKGFKRPLWGGKKHFK